mmetsp:Transcript_17894/g.12846  ORF Transcript_17894/g.12846 Transcript_17894/m.12846 type:complete len:115 (+) Transcript_17894:358-702(+)
MGILSYPRTETTIFHKTIDLRSIVRNLTKDTDFGISQHALKIANQKKDLLPNNGKLDDKAHPPIHPVKFCQKTDLSDNESKVYDLITRYFLACLSQNAFGNETSVMIKIDNLKF